MMTGFLAYCFFNSKKRMSNFENQISQLESQSLQAQMNPHFIFNVLNNIQSVLILKSEKEINYFMGHLSTLVRLTLNMSKQKFIALSEEIEYLKSYLELQCLRTNSKFDYCFDINFDLDISKIHLPPLLLQPLVENAILHGITPSKHKGILVVSVKEKENGLLISVEDNGVGLTKSKLLKKKNRTVF
jgi:LytS/YehU family sensor histidine kinase